MPLDTIISFKDVPVFQKDNLILSDVTFDLEKGEFLYIIGKTGTGKSSLPATTVLNDYAVATHAMAILSYSYLSTAPL